MPSLPELALQIATAAHAGQTRRNGEPYVNHPIRVAERVEGELNKAVALLHDTIEDCGMTVADLVAKGMPDEVAQDVLTLSRRKEETYDLFILRVIEEGSPRATLVKVADIDDNLADFDPATAKAADIQRADKYRLARRLLVLCINLGHHPSSRLAFMAAVIKARP